MTKIIRKTYHFRVIQLHLLPPPRFLLYTLTIQCHVTQGTCNWIHGQELQLYFKLMHFALCTLALHGPGMLRMETAELVCILLCMYMYVHGHPTCRDLSIDLMSRNQTNQHLS